MKKISYITLFISFILFLSGCSQGYRSNTYNQHPIQQQQVRTTVNQATQAPAKRTVQAVPQLRIKQQAAHTSQQTRSNAVANQHHARNLMSRIANNTLGAPYKWGGNNPQQGFDCSGLTSYVHKNALGINIPRTAAQQRDQSRTISYEQLLPGDMLFFKTSKTANHVGIYIGKRKFVHAATGSKEVKVASMDSAYWHKRFVKFGTFL